MATDIVPLAEEAAVFGVETAHAHDAPAAPSPGASGAVSRTLWGSLVLIGLAGMAGAAARAVFGAMQEVVSKDLHLSDVRMSLVQGAAAAIPIAMLSLPLGRLADRSRRVNITLAMAFLAVAGTFVTAFAVDFWSLYIGRMLAGVGAICAISANLSLLADFSSPQTRGRANLVASFGNVIGAVVATMAGGKLYGMFLHGPGLLGMNGWRQVHLVFGIGCALLMLPLLLLREPRRQEVSKGGSLPLGPSLKALWALAPVLLPLYIGQIGVVMVDTAATFGAPPVLTRVFGLEPQQFAIWLGLAALVAGIFAPVMGALAADFGQKLKMRGGIMLGAIAGGALTIPTSFFAMMPTPTGFMVLLTLMLIGGVVAGLVTSVAIQVIVPNELRGMAIGIFVVITAVIGLGAAPTVVTLISALLGGQQHLGQALAIVGVGIAVISTAGFVMAMINSPARAVGEG